MDHVVHFLPGRCCTASELHQGTDARGPTTEGIAQGIAWIECREGEHTGNACTQRDSNTDLLQEFFAQYLQFQQPSLHHARHPILHLA